ncbi:RNA methyltransferase [Cellulosimicrobium cellulans]|uniref:TrmH family RNA methyltransferase n=1 Tax=Cellulosimicrobium cellulans TaxID=1710 RepID=UPI0018840990|nr:RNA methyltransferase [Cellulosimicrobium cellulans]
MPGRIDDVSETSTRAGLRVVHVTDPADDRLADYNRLTDVALRSKHEPEKGLYIAESSTVIRRALAAGHRPRSFLMAERWLDDLADDIAALPVDDAPGGTGEQVPVYVGAPDVLEAITGFHLHRGALAAMHRPPLVPVRDLLSAARGGTGALRVAVLEDVVDHTNIGAALRACAAMGVDAVLVTPSCADPLYRRSIRVSMGTVFQVPWTRLEHWPHGPRDDAAPGGVDLLQELGYTVAALALDDDSVSLDELAANPPERLAMVFGTEGDGLKRRTVAACDLTVRIPMAGGVDSLNVASAVAVAAWAMRS